MSEDTSDILEEATNQLLRILPEEMTNGLLVTEQAILVVGVTNEAHDEHGTCAFYTGEVTPREIRSLQGLLMEGVDILEDLMEQKVRES